MAPTALALPIGINILSQLVVMDGTGGRKWSLKSRLLRDIGSMRSMATWSGGRSELISHFNSIPVTASMVSLSFIIFVQPYLTFLNRGGTTRAPGSNPHLPGISRCGSKNCPFGNSLFVKTGLVGCRRCQCQWRISLKRRGVLSHWEEGARPEVD